MFSKTSYNSTTKIWSGTCSEQSFDKTKSLGEIILEALDYETEKVTQISDNNGFVLTKAEIKSRSLKLAKYIENQGLKPGDVIGAIARNTENIAAVLFGAILNGTPVNTLDINYRKDDLIHMFTYTKPKFVFCDSDTYTIVKESMENLNLKAGICTVRGRIANIDSVEDVLLKISDAESSSFVPFKVKDTTKYTALILCSSGTTGLPKGVCISHAQLNRKQPYIEGITAVCFSPIFWLSSVTVLITATINQFSRVITDEPFSPELMLELIEKYKAGFVFSPPTYMAFMLNSQDVTKRDLSSVKLYLCTGSAVSANMFEKMAKYLPNAKIFSSYGMTEVATGCSTGAIYQKAGSVGQLNANVQVKILDDDGKQLGIRDNGEICIKTPLEFLGYYGRPDETQRILDVEGWIHSGDIGYFDDEGFLYLIDRKKDILKYNGHQYYPTEIENVIQAAFEIEQVCVCGIPDPFYGDLPAAVVVNRKGSKIAESDIVDHVVRKMADYKQLRGGVYFVDTLPMTSSGKCIRARVRDMAAKFYEERQK